MKKIWKRSIGLLLVVVFCTSYYGILAKAEEEVVLRVGLIDYYEHEDVIEIKNNAVRMGYMKDSDYVVEQSFQSSGGFLFEEAKGLYVVIKKNYKTYDEAHEIAVQLRKDGQKAYPATVALGVWNVYVEAPSKAASIKVKADLAKKHKFQLETKSDNGYRTKMSFGQEMILMENTTDHGLFEGVEEESIIDLGKRRYRGRMEIGRYKEEGLTAINVIEIYDYLYGVVPAEMPRGWHMEALKAQAIVSKNYAIYKGTIASPFKSKAYDLTDTTSSQAYKGVGVEYDRTNEAVDAIRGLSIYYNNKIIPTYFFSTSGGRTESSQNVWVGSVGYLRSVSDIYELPYRKPWVKELTASEIAEKLNDRGVDLGQIKDVVVEGYSPSGRALHLRIVGTKGEKVLVKETMRYWLGLASRKFHLVKEGTKIRETFHTISDNGTKEVPNKELYVINGSGEKVKVQVGEENPQTIIVTSENVHNVPQINGKKGTFAFVGQGNGHGIGMSQSGSRGMAEAGFTFTEIVKHYYTGVEVR